MHITDIILNIKQIMQCNAILGNSTWMCLILAYMSFMFPKRLHWFEGFSRHLERGKCQMTMTMNIKIAAV